MSRMIVIATAMAALTLSGCMTSGVQVSESQLNQFERGVTTEADVVHALGKPTSVATSDGIRVVSYGGMHAQARPESFIPFVGAFVGGADATVSVVSFTFGLDGKLTNMSSQHSDVGSTSGLRGQSEPQQADQPRKVE